MGLNLWPFGKTPERWSVDYTSMVVAGLESNRLAAVELCENCYGRAIGSAQVNHTALAPEILDSIGRSLIARGEWVGLIQVDATGLRLLPVADWTIDCGYDPRAWTYEVTNTGPSITSTRRIEGDGVVHLRYGCDPRRPWVGQSPLTKARTSLKMLAYLESRMTGELEGPVGTILQIPNEANTQPGLQELSRKLNMMRGQAVPFISTGGLRDPNPGSDYRPIRLGANPPQSLVLLHRQAMIHVDRLWHTSGVPGSR